MRPALHRPAARRVGLGFAAALAVGLTAAPSASAAFSVAKCRGEGILARGASFQVNAINGFRDVFALTTECGATAPFVAYDPAGSGAGKRALGLRGDANPSHDRDPSVRLGAADEPPPPSERQDIENGTIDSNGVDVTNADDSPLHVIPVAIGAIAVMVHLPDGCDYTAATNRPDLGGANRPAINNDTLEKAFAGDESADTWAEVIPGVTPVDATCGNAPVRRVVRLDSSGTTFAFKQLLQRINPARSWSPPGLGNQAWPNMASHPVIRAKINGGQALTSVLFGGQDANEDNGTTSTARTLDFGAEGGIGYVDLASARAGGFTWDDASSDKTFWTPLQRGTPADPRAGAVYDDPQANLNGYKTSVSSGGGTPVRGANCAAVTPRNVPLTPGDSTLGDWSPTDATATGAGYAACALTYQLAFDDNSDVYCDSASEERKARTVKDWLTMIVNAGQDSLDDSDYDALPGNILAAARFGVQQIDWRKDGSGRPCSTPPGTGGGGGGGGGGTGGGSTPPPSAPSNVFTIASARALTSGSSIRLSLQVPGPGKLAVASTAKPTKGKAIKLATQNVNVAAAGTQRVTLALSSKAKKALKKSKLTVTMRITFTPTGGSPRTVTRKVTVKARKAAPRR